MQLVKPMRRTIALSLLMIFGWSLMAPLFAPDAEANLPSCCRRNGKHHCMMHLMERLSGKQSGIASVSEKCPCMPASTGAIHSASYKPEPGARFYGEVARHPSRAPQTEAQYRLSFLRSRQKRGPPTSSFMA